MEELLLVQEEPHRISEGHQLAQDGGDGRAPDAQSEPEDENGVQDGVGCHREQGEPHRDLGISGRPDDAVEPEIEMGDGIAQGDDGHIVPCEGEGGVAGAEKTQDRIHPDQGHDGEDDACQDVQGHFVGQDLVRDAVILLAQQDGDHRGGTDAHEGAESRGNVHQREGDGKTGDG